MLRRLALAVLVLALGAALAPLAFAAGPCTKGVDCYCDKVKPGQALADGALALCEDFEAPGLRSAVGVGNGAPLYGPICDSTGQPGNYGNNSYWNKYYGNGPFDTIMPSGFPSSNPAGCSACSGGGSCVGMVVWEKNNLWGANAGPGGVAPIAAFPTQASDFTADAGTAPSNTANGPNGVFDGNASLAYRVPAGNHADILGSGSFVGGTANEVGLTQAMAYDVGSAASGVWGNPAASWKGNEWIASGPNASSGCSFDGLFTFYNQNGPFSGRPFAGFIGAFGNNCNGVPGYTGTILSVAAGAAQATPIGIIWNSPSNYSQTVDWPEGSWGCIQGHAIITGNQIRHRVWFQGPAMTTPRLIIDFTATTTGLDATQGWSGIKWNPYANTNQSGSGYTPSNTLTHRYEDNVHIRRGLPVPCSQIGFSGSAPPPPPNAPSNAFVTVP